MSVWNKKVVVTERSLFASRLITARKKTKMSQGQVAEIVGKSCHTAVVNWENDRATPSLKDFMVLCEIYKVTPNDLLLDSPASDQAKIDMLAGLLDANQKQECDEIKEAQARITELEQEVQRLREAILATAEKFDGIWDEQEYRWLEKEGDELRAIAQNKE